MAPVDAGLVPLKMRPMAFDAPSELKFVNDLMTFYESSAGKTALEGRSLYLLRNADSKAKGLGFALAGNFYPDFLLWLVDDDSGHQWLSFVDPKGLRQVNLADPKLQLFTEIKTLENSFNDPKLTLNAFILTDTAYGDLLNVTSVATKAELEDRRLLFMDGTPGAYIGKMLDRALARLSPSA